MANTIRFPLLVAVGICLCLLVWLALSGSANADGTLWVPIYDGTLDNFADWQTNHPTKFYWDQSASAYHYAITDAADDYAFVNVPYHGGSFRLEFDVLPVRTDWSGNFRLGLWDQQLWNETASSIYAHYFLDDNGYHVYLQCYWPGGAASVRPCGYSDGQWYHTGVEYSAETHSTVITVTNIASGQTFTGAVQNLGDFVGLDRIAMTSIGDYGYPPATAEGYIRNVRLARAYPGTTVTVSVPATSPWSTDTGVCLTAGQQFAVDATGQWTSGAWTGGPNGQDGQPPTGSDWLLPGSRPYALIGKIGAGGAPFFIGSGGIFTALAAGNLILSMNDVPGVFWDNSGALNVSITIPATIPPPVPAISINAGAACTNSTSATLSVSCPSDCAQIRFRNDPGEWGPWEPCTGSKTWTLPTGDGPKRVCAHCRDSSGNIGPESCAEIRLDTTPPAPPAFSINGGARCTTSRQVIITYACPADAVSVNFKNEGAGWSPEWLPCSGSATWFLSSGSGRKLVYAVSRDACGNISAVSQPVSIYIPSFADVGCADSFLPYVEALIARAITSGCSTHPPLFCPYSSLTRAQMAVFLCKAAGKGPLYRDVPTFCDVPKADPYYGWIERIGDPDSWNGNPPTIGCAWLPCKKYCPGKSVTREEMAAFLVRATARSPMSSCSGVFSDVPKGAWSCPYIERLADPASWPAGVAVTTGCACPSGYGPGTKCYCPQSPVTRGQMAVFLVRAFGIPL